MPVGADFTVITDVPGSAIEEQQFTTHPIDYNRAFETRGVRLDESCVLCLEWAREDGTSSFEVNIEINGEIISVRVPREESDGRFHVEYIVFRGAILNNNEQNFLVMQPTTQGNQFLLRSAMVFFHQSF